MHRIGALGLAIVAGQVLVMAAPLPRGRGQETGADATAVHVTAADCTVARLGTSIEPSAIGEPVRAVTLAAPS